MAQTGHVAPVLYLVLVSLWHCAKGCQCGKQAEGAFVVICMKLKPWQM